MATLYKSNQSQAPRPALGVSQSGQPVSVRGFFPLTIATVLNDVFQLIPLPANSVIDDLVLDIDTVDSNAAPAAVLQVGVLNAAGTALAGPALIATTAAQSKAGGIFRAVTVELARVKPKSYQRYLGVLTQTAPATGVAPTAVTLNRGVWAPATQYNLGDYLIQANGVMQKCTTAGISAATALLEPEWTTTNAGTTADGTAVWTVASVVVGLSIKYRAQNFGA